MTNQAHVLEELSAVMSRRARALEARDVDALSPMLADEFTYVNSQGALLTKQEYLSFVERGALRWSSQTADHVAVRTYGETAVITCRVRDVGTWEGMPFDAVFCSILSDRSSGITTCRRPRLACSTYGNMETGFFIVRTVAGKSPQIYAV